MTGTRTWSRCCWTRKCRRRREGLMMEGRRYIGRQGRAQGRGRAAWEMGAWEGEPEAGSGETQMTIIINHDEYCLVPNIHIMNVMYSLWNIICYFISHVAPSNPLCPHPPSSNASSLLYSRKTEYSRGTRFVIPDASSGNFVRVAVGIFRAILRSHH